MRARIAQLVRSKVVLVALVALVAAAVAGTTVGYTALNKTVTLSVDGRSTQVNALGGTVGDLLDGEDITVGEKDLVAPALDEAIVDGGSVSVQYGRPLELAIDGESRTYWVNSTNVARALGEIGRRFSGADLSVSRSAQIGRSGMTLDVVTSKVLKVKVGAKKFKKHKVTALTVSDALDSMGVHIGKHDQVRPSADTQINNGDKIVVTKIRVATKKAGEPIGHSVITRNDSSMYEGKKSVVRNGRDGARKVTYRLRFVNGKLATRKVVKSSVGRKPVAAIVKVGTKAKWDPVVSSPESSAPDFSGGSTVWDQLAQCESGGNWAINTGNGYYGGLQFSLATWRSYGGTGLPSQNSRETQIAVATKLRDAAGGYGAWPACSSSLGLR